MSGADKKGQVIEVTFVNAETSAVFAQSTVPSEQLPQSFEASTTLHLGDQDWEVVQATPMTAEEWTTTGRLHLALRQVQVTEMDPAAFLFSLPTISDDLPAIEEGTTKLGKTVLEMPEDDWRQIEFVSHSHEPEIAVALEGIRRVYAEQRTEGGTFHRLHLRKGLSEPIASGDVPFGHVTALVPEGAVRCDGVSFKGQAGTLAYAFAWQVSGGLMLYGRARQGQVAELGLHFRGPAGEVETFGQELARFASAHHVALVDWCRATRIASDAAALVTHLQEGQPREPGQRWEALP